MQTVLSFLGSHKKTAPSLGATERFQTNKSKLYSYCC